MSVRQANSRTSRRALVNNARQLRQRQTKSEQLLWQMLRNRRLDGQKFRRQARIGHYVVDFYCPESRLVVEVDGAVHETQAQADRERQQALENMQLRVLRVRPDDVERRARDVLQAIRYHLAPLSLEEGEGRG